MKGKTKKWFIWLLIISIVVGIIVFYFKSKKPITTYTTDDATKGTLMQTVSVTGDLVAQDEITLNFEIGGRVSKVFAKVSDKVAAGDKIATLTDATLQKQVDQAKAGLDQAIANAGANNDTLHEAKISKDNADNTLSQTKNLNDQSISAAKKAVDNAQNYYDDTLTYYNSLSDGSAKLQAKPTLTAAENSLNTAKETLKTTQEQADLAKTNAENGVESTNARVKTVQSEYARSARNAQIAAAQAVYDMSVLNLAKSTLVFLLMESSPR
ncbi:MAG: biotin/lipoyl-binding protein [bacterium]